MTLENAVSIKAISVIECDGAGGSADLTYSGSLACHLADRCMAAMNSAAGVARTTASHSGLSCCSDW